MRLNTLTHARLRLAQGDSSGARRVLESLLSRNPGHSEALELLQQLGGTVPPAPSEPAPGLAAPGDGPAAPDRRIDRLQRWMRRVSRERPPTA